MTISADTIRGLYTAIVTPLKDDKSVDIAALKKLVRFQLESGAAGIVPIGGTGEYPAFSRSERKAIVEACVEAAEGKPVIPGVVSPGFQDAVEAGKDFAAAGASGVMTVTPYYATGTQEAIRSYFKSYRQEVDLPVLLYQIPYRTNVSVAAETIAGMAEDGSIVGMKYSSYDVPEFIKTVQAAGDKIAILSGEESLFATHVALGARGGVLASATIYPKVWVDVFEMASQGKLTEALALQAPVNDVVKTIFLETNPGPLKTYMALAGMPVGSVRLPLQDPSAATLAKLKDVAKQAKLVNLA
ncbi:4-hydroxy-tetrahydrodipicolinate synthase [Neorhizobium alkalisoli]|jgi:4-hydroxy-tetrahydrodipicolinate synthase|uniref:4-hydroxy-tetrahydrodipicolinate synthase n=1 Tax=Neorhizobium alkalisoli TaxID=528178 RepID=A0A561R863_9HYPH|nr:4-hydroxy-tetrahydrodipicolinate synthase [Neorhizobium alkalisoli]TWF58800.1 4-hydroxy-tetrahydrodipicolinate synthase [Neorhizobium alkalisoli]